MSINEVIDVVTMGYRLVPTTRAVDVSRLMPTTRVCWSAAIRIGIGYFQFVLFDLSVGADMVQVSVM